MNKPSMLTYDASKTAIAFVLGQLDNQGREHVIAYGGRNLSKTEPIWSTTEHECLAVVLSISVLTCLVDSKSTPITKL